LSAEQGYVFFINNAIPPMESTLSELYSRYKDDNGFLQVIVCKESIFG
jgi:hypothetical protein